MKRCSKNSYLNISFYVECIRLYRANEVDSENHVASIICTSETDGTAKGICVSHALLLETSTLDTIAERDVTFSSTTIFWFSGVYMLIAPTIAGAKRVISTKDFSPAYLAELIPKYGVSKIEKNIFYL